MTARDVIARAICHDEQLEIWADEFLEHLLGGDFIRAPDSYEEKLDLVSCVKTAIKELVEKAFDHPELQTPLLQLVIHRHDLQSNERREPPQRQSPAEGGQGNMSTDPFESVTPPLKIVDEMIAIPRAHYEAYRAAAELLPRMHKAADILMAWLISKDDKFLPSKSTVWPDVVASHEAIKALRAAGILEGHCPND